MELILTNPAPPAAPRPRAQQGTMFDGFEGKWAGKPDTVEHFEMCEMCPDYKSCPLRRAGARACGKLVR